MTHTSSIIDDWEGIKTHSRYFVNKDATINLKTELENYLVTDSDVNNHFGEWAPGENY